MTREQSGPFILAVDAGTTYIKAGLVSAQGKVVALSQRATPYLPAPLPAFEIDMDALAAAALDTMQLCCQAAGVSSVEAIAITAQGDGLWPLAKDGRPAGPAMVWRDGRSDDVTERWRRLDALSAVVQITGTYPTASHQTAQLAWLRMHAPDRIRSVSSVMFAEDWIGYELTGVPGVCMSGNYEHTYGHFHSLRHQIVNPATEVLRLLDLAWAQPLLPDPAPALEARGALRAEAARHIGITAGTPVFAGPFDVLTATLGAGATQLDQAASIWGTAAIHGRWVSAFSPLQTGCLVSHPQSSGRWLRFVPTSAGMPNFNYWRDLLFREESREGNWPEIESYAAQSPGGANGLLYFPYLTASHERSEVMSRVSGACFLGMHEGHQRGDYLRAVYEGLAVQAGRIFRELKRLDIPLREARVAGGGGQSNLLSDLLASAADLRVVRPATTEASLLGAAMIALVGIGYATSLDDLAQSMAPPAHVFEPEPEQVSFYARMTASVERLLECLAISRPA